MNNKVFNGEAFGEFPRYDHETFGTNSLVVGHVLDHARAGEIRRTRPWLTRDLLRRNREYDGLTIGEVQGFLKKIKRKHIEIIFGPDFVATQYLRNRDGKLPSTLRDGDLIDDLFLGGN